MKLINRLKLKTEDGVALVWVLIMMTIVITLTASMTFIAQQDILETRLHEERLETYYLALAGVDLGYAALMANSGSEPYINQFLNDSTKSVTDTIDIYDGAIKTGEAIVTIESVTVDSKRWIRVYSIGTLIDGTHSVASILRINPDNTQHTIREAFTP